MPQVTAIEREKRLWCLALKPNLMADHMQWKQDGTPSKEPQKEMKTCEFNVIATKAKVHYKVFEDNGVTLETQEFHSVGTQCETPSFRSCMDKAMEMDSCNSTTYTHAHNCLNREGLSRCQKFAVNL